MHTTTHVLVSTALFTRSGPGNRARNAAAILGGLVPDVPMFIMFGWSKWTATPEYEVWTHWYFNPPWQTVIDYSHSIPLWLAVLAIGWFMPAGRPGASPPLQRFAVVLALAALSHIALDLPVHIDDAHAHFVPFTEWRFRSPVSYWNPAHYGNVVMVFEVIGDILLCAILWRRFGHPMARASVAFGAATYLAPQIYFGALHHWL